MVTLSPTFLIRVMVAVVVTRLSLSLVCGHNPEYNEWEEECPTLNSTV